MHEFERALLPATNVHKHVGTKLHVCQRIDLYHRCKAGEPGEIEACQLAGTDTWIINSAQVSPESGHGLGSLPGQARVQGSAARLRKSGSSGQSQPQQCGKHHTIFAAVFPAERGEIEPVHQGRRAIKDFARWFKRRYQSFVAFVPWTVDGEAVQAWQPIGRCVAIAMGTKAKARAQAQGIPPLLPEGLRREGGDTTLGDELIKYAA